VVVCLIEPIGNITVYNSKGVDTDMDIKTNETASGSDWKEWSKYVLITLEKLGEGLSQYNKDNLAFKEETFKSLTIIREKLSEEMKKCSSKQNNNLNKIIKELESLINNISNRTIALEKVDVDKTVDFIIDKKFIDLNEKILYPLRIKVALVSLIAGCCGGLLLTFAVAIIKTVFGG